MKTALAALSALVALGGFIVTQWVRYQRQSLKYQMELTDNIYYRNINNMPAFSTTSSAPPRNSRSKRRSSRTISCMKQRHRRSRLSSIAASRTGCARLSESISILMSATRSTSSSSWGFLHATASGSSSRRSTTRLPRCAAYGAAYFRPPEPPPAATPSLRFEQILAQRRAAVAGAKAPAPL
jgi:Protein of unknown function (DUF3754)